MYSDNSTNHATTPKRVEENGNNKNNANRIITNTNTELSTEDITEPTQKVDQSQQILMESTEGVEGLTNGSPVMENAIDEDGNASIPKSVINTVLPNSLRNTTNLQHQSVFLDVVDAFQTYIGDKLQMVEHEMAQQETEIKILQNKLTELSSGHQEQEIYIFQVIRNASAQLQAKQSVLSQSLRKSRDGKIEQLKVRVVEYRLKVIKKKKSTATAIHKAS